MRLLIGIIYFKKYKKTLKGISASEWWTQGWFNKNHLEVPNILYITTERNENKVYGNY